MKHFEVKLIDTVPSLNKEEVLPNEVERIFRLWAKNAQDAVKRIAERTFLGQGPYPMLMGVQEI